MPLLDHPPPISFLPALRAGDALAEYWLRNVTLRLRREVCWLWRERASTHAGHSGNGALPPFSDRLGSALDLSRYAAEKRRFFQEDETASFLSRLIDEPSPPIAHRCPPERGSFSWVARELALSEVDCFVLALALGPAIDSATGAVYAACLNDPGRTTPTLALAQRLWPDASALLVFAAPTHSLFTHGLLTFAAGWDAPLAVAPAIASSLFSPGELPPSLRLLAADEGAWRRRRHG